MSTSDESRECLTIRAQGRNVIVRLALKPILSFGLVLGSSKRLIIDVRKHTKVLPYFQRGEKIPSPPHKGSVQSSAHYTGHVCTLIEPVSTCGDWSALRLDCQ